MRKSLNYRTTILYLCFSLGFVQCNVNGPIVTVSSGQIRGGVAESRDGRTFTQFQGIPYGKFHRRFETSVPADAWTGVKDAKDPGSLCYQKTFHTADVVGEEDCLVLNVYTPFLPSGQVEKLPVLFFVHGGALFSGASTLYGPSYMMDEDVVLVTVNYRLGAFGFLDLGIKAAPGNQGAKDVVLALKWVRENIAAFNGDPGHVTVFGESAGGAIVSNLIYSPMSQGLFVNAIAQSGTGIAPFSTNPHPKKYAHFIASKVNCSTEGSSSEEIVDCLQTQDKLDILNTISPLEPDWSFWEDEVMDREFPFSFSIEDEIEGEEAFLPDIVKNLVTKGQFNKVPLLIGVNSREGIFLLGELEDKEKLYQLNTDWNHKAPIMYLYYNYGRKLGEKSFLAKRDELSQKIKAFYFKNKRLAQNDPETVEVAELSFSDFLFAYPARNLADKLSGQGVESYLYFFEKQMTGELIGPMHAEELNYLFPVPPPDGKPGINRNSPDYTFSKNMIKLWVSFAKTGKPSHTWGEKTEEWTAFNDSENVKWFHIKDNGVEGRFEDPGLRARMEFWKEADENESVEPTPLSGNKVEL